METVDEYVAELNKMANTYQIKTRKVMWPLLLSFKKRFEVNFIFIDLESYDEELLHIVESEKMKYLRMQKFTIAKIFRNIEDTCLECAELKKKHNPTKSTFIYNQGNLFFFCLGTTYVDESVRKFYQELIKIESLHTKKVQIRFFNWIFNCVKIRSVENV